jgi:pantothenate kinase
VDRLNEQAPGVAALLPMDGFPLRRPAPRPRGPAPRKGAPETFDVGGLRHPAAACGARRGRRRRPVFDRDIEIARAGARLIPASAR